MSKNRTSRSLPIGLAAFCLLALTASLSAITGREIMDEQRRRHEASTEETRSVMKLIDSRGRERTREMVAYSRTVEGALSQSLLKFLVPSNIRNTGLLTWEQPEDKEDQQWLYLPASGRVNQISGSNKKNLFMQSDLAFEDLRPENLNAHSYELLREEEVDGEACWVIESLPATEKERGDSGYSKRTFWVRKDIYLTVKIEFFDRGGKLAKRGTYGDLEQVDGDLWRSNEITMERLRSGTKTVWSFEERRVNEPIDENLFTQQGLKRPPRL